MKDEIGIKIELIKKDIFNMAGEEFNLNSPKQLGDILFDKIGVPAGKKDKNGHFPAGTVNYLVYEKLKKYAKISEDK